MTVERLYWKVICTLVGRHRPPPALMPGRPWTRCERCGTRILR